MIIRIPGLGRATRAHLQIDYTSRVYLYVSTCVGRVPHSFYFLACIMHVEASLHCQWRIGKVPPISDRRHFSGRDVCRRFLEKCVDESHCTGVGGGGEGRERGSRKIYRKFFTQSMHSHLYISGKIFADNTRWIARCM